MNRREREVMHWTAAKAHKDAAPTPKRMASRMGVADRTARRWGNPDEAKGSPLAQYAAALDRPARAEAFLRVTTLMPVVRGWSRERLIAEYRAAVLRGVHNEAADTCNHLDPEVDWLDVAAGAERDLADDLLIAACARRFAELGLSRKDVLDS